MSPSYRDPRALRQEAARLLATADAIENGTWHFVCEIGGTPQALAERLGISSQSANNHLRKLYDLSLIDREYMPRPGGGRAYSYRWRPR